MPATKKSKRSKNLASKNSEVPIDIPILCNSSAPKNVSDSNSVTRPQQNNLNENCENNEIDDRSEAVFQRKPKKKKFVKPNFDIEISCRPGPSNIHAKGVCNNITNDKNSKKNSKSYAYAVSNIVNEPVHECYWAASHSQSSSRYDEYSRCHQCCPMSLVALITLPNCSSEAKFTTAVLDSILKRGDQLYREVSDIPQVDLEFNQFDDKIFLVGGKRYHIDVKIDESRTVHVQFMNGNPDLKSFVTIDYALLDHLLKYDRLWIMMGENAASIFLKFGKYYVFDSHSRIINGDYDEAGHGSLWSFSDSSNLKKFIERQVKKFCTNRVSYFSIVPVIIKEVQQTSAIPQNMAGFGSALEGYFQNQKNNIRVPI